MLVSRTLIELEPGTTYHYALVATNALGTTVIGPDQTFTTSPATPPIVSGLSVSGVTQTGATLTGTIDPQGLQTTY